MKSEISRVATLESTLAESELVFRLLDESSHGPFEDNCDALYTRSMDAGRTYFDEMARWRSADYAIDAMEASGTAACFYEASLDDLLVCLTHQDASEELQGRIVRTMGLQIMLEKDLRALVAYLVETARAPVPEKLGYILIGGRGHGSRVEIAEDAGEYESEMYSDEESTKSIGYETYEKRTFTGSGFGEGFECYGLSEDDRVETRELARFLLHQQNILSEQGVGGA